MSRQVVHDNNVAWCQGRAENLLDIGQEGAPVHRTVEDHGSGHAAQAQAGHEGRGLPMPMRNTGAQPLAPLRPAAQAGHLGRGASLVDEDKRLRIEVGLVLEPGLTGGRDVRSILLGRVSRFF